MSFSRSAVSALAAGSVAAAVIFALVMRAPERDGADDGHRLPRFVVFVSTASTGLLDNPEITRQLELVALPSPDRLEQQMGQLDADGVILDGETVTQVTSAGLLSLFKSGRVVATLGVPTWEVQRLAGLDFLRTPRPRLNGPTRSFQSSSTRKMARAARTWTTRPARSPGC